MARFHRFYAVLGALVCLTAGCSSKNNSGSSENGATDPLGGKPKPAAIECGSLGAQCLPGGSCGSGVSCLMYTGNLFSSDPGLCAPLHGSAINCAGDSGCSAQTPICMTYTQGTAGTCVSEPELDCVCKDPFGSATVTRCQSTLQSGRACIAQGGKCDQVPCCSGEICKADTTGQAVCQLACTSDSDCTSNCCSRAPNSSIGVCGAAADCCSSQGGACGSAGDHPCCSASTCISFGTDPYACAKICTADSDCGTGCCVPVSNANHSSCAPKEQCGTSSSCTSEVGANCDNINCCSNLACVAPAGVNTFTCQPTCTQRSDCGTNCCVPITDAGYSACLPATSCG